MTLSRRDFVQLAAAMGASLAWSGPARASRTKWRERRDLYPEGVASGDPDPSSVILWTRRPFDGGDRHVLTVEVAEDEAFRRVVAHAPAPVSAASDWTTRVLVGGLKPSRTYWYRFTDARREWQPDRPDHHRARGRRSAPGQLRLRQLPGRQRGQAQRLSPDDLRGRARAAPADQLDFVLHLGDFIYEVVEYPDEVKTRYDRTIYEVARIPDGHKVGNFHYPLTVDGYRAVYKGYLADPICRTRARAGRSSPCGTITNSPGRAGRASSRRAVRRGRGRASRSPPTRRGSNICRHACNAPSGIARRIRPAGGEGRRRSRNWTRTASALEPNNLIAINSLKATGRFATASTST